MHIANNENPHIANKLMQRLYSASRRLCLENSKALQSNTFLLGAMTSHTKTHRGLPAIKLQSWQVRLLEQMECNLKHCGSYTIIWRTDLLSPYQYGQQPENY